VSNRHQRRAASKQRKVDVARFRHELGGEGLDTYLVFVADVDLLARKPLLARAGCNWAEQLSVKRPVCIACKASFGEDAVGSAAKPGSFLFATSRRAPDACATSVSAICEWCVARLSDAEIDQVCTDLLRQLIPGGVLEPMPVRW
jgi:hypothetical protein